MNMQSLSWSAKSPNREKKITFLDRLQLRGISIPSRNSRECEISRKWAATKKANTKQKSFTWNAFLKDKTGRGEFRGREKECGEKIK